MQKDTVQKKKKQLPTKKFGFSKIRKGDIQRKHEPPDVAVSALVSFGSQSKATW